MIAPGWIFIAAMILSSLGRISFIPVIFTSVTCGRSLTL